MKVLIKCVLFASLMANASSVTAIVNIDATRIVINSDQKRGSFKLVNEGKEEMVVQLWTDYGDILASPSLVKTPVFLTPPILNLKPGEIKSIQAIVDRQMVDQQKDEQIYWLNIYQVSRKFITDEIAPFSDELVLPIRLRIKLLVRPQGIEKLEKTAGEQLTFGFEPASGHTSATVSISNPTPWNISLLYLTINGQEITPPLIPANGSVLLARPITQPALIEYAIINDFGNGWEYKKNIK